MLIGNKTQNLLNQVWKLRRNKNGIKPRNTANIISLCFLSECG